jgi:ankyrin repeat protein
VAVAEADKNVVAALLILKADPRIKNNALNTPVHMAAREGKVEILQVSQTNKY